MKDKPRTITIMASKDTSLEAKQLIKYIHAQTKLEIQLLTPDDVIGLGRAIRDIKGYLVLVYMDFNIYPTSTHMRNFMKYMIRSNIPVLGLDPGFVQYGGLIELSKPKHYLIAEAFNQQKKVKSYQIEYYSGFTDPLGYTKSIESAQIPQ
jgi:ABC-type uncharacterized transport system substrate-binding protein